METAPPQPTQSTLPPEVLHQALASHMPPLPEKNHRELTQNEKLMLQIEPWIHKIVVWGLIFQGMYRLVKSGIFLFQEIPALNIAFSQGTVTQDSINTLASKTILISIVAFLNMVFALRLSTVKAGLVQKIHTVIGVILFFGHTWFLQYLNSHNSSAFVSQFFLRFMQP